MTQAELKWLEMYDLAKTFYHRYHNLDIKRSYQLVSQGQKIYLGNWISAQRYNKKRGKLTYSQIQLLDEIDMIWDKSNHFHDDWNKMFELAKNFYNSFKHLNIPKYYRVDNDGHELPLGTSAYEAEGAIKLGIWIINQRQAYKGIGNGKMTERKIRLLNSIGMIWSINDLEWTRMYHYAKSYYETYNHLNVHLHYRIDSNGTELLKGTKAYNSENSIKLGQWISVQRLNKKNGILSIERIALLENIGMVWNSKNNKEEIKELCKVYGIDLKLNQSILNKPYNEVMTKIAFLEDIGEPIIIDSRLHSIFFMADINMQMIYNVSMEELLTKYINTKVKGIS